MEPHLYIWRFFRQQRLTSNVRYFGCLALTVVFLSGWLGPSTLVQTCCHTTNQNSAVTSGDTSGYNTTDFSTTLLDFAEYKKISVARRILLREKLSILVQSTNKSHPVPSQGKSHPVPSQGKSHPAPRPGNSHPTPSQGSGHPAPSQGSGNVFPYGSCTWWANQRYYQLHGFYVPWRTQATAWQWTDRAHQFNWRVSSQPSLGAIVVLRPGVQGASGAGHVAVVEKILPNGHVIASNMSWGRSPGSVTNVEFTPGPGVSFISAN